MFRIVQRGISFDHSFVRHFWLAIQNALRAKRREEYLQNRDDELDVLSAHDGNLSASIKEAAL